MNHGWQCPVCKIVLAPKQTFCLFCSFSDDGKARFKKSLQEEETRMLRNIAPPDNLVLAGVKKTKDGEERDN